MKILHLDCEPTWRGGEQQMVYLLRDLQKAGVTSRVLAHQDNPLVQKVAALGIAIETWAMRSFWQPAAVWQLRQTIRAFAPDIIHTHDARTLSTLVAFNLAHGSQIVAHRRVDFAVSRISGRYKYRHASRIIAVSNCVAEIVQRAGIDPAKITVIHDGIELDEFSTLPERIASRGRFDIPAGAIHIGAAGSLVDHKNHAVLIDAAALLAAHLPVFFTIAGNGPLYDALHARILKRGVANQVKLLGFVHKMLPYYASLDIFVQPSKLEGLGSSILEAMAAAVPVIGARAGGIPEIVAGSGLLFDSNNAAQLADSIGQLLAADQRAALARQSRARAAQFASSAQNQKILDVYRDVLKA